MGIDFSSLNALLAQAKNMVSTGPRSSALCQHANEVPRGPCSCPQTCYCKQDGGCRPWQMGAPSPDWIRNRVELALPCGTTWEQNETPADLILTARPSTALPNVSLPLDNLPSDWSIRSIDAGPRRIGIVFKHTGGKRVLLALYFDPLPDTDTGFWQKLTDPDSL